MTTFVRFACLAATAAGLLTVSSMSMAEQGEVDPGQVSEGLKAIFSYGRASHTRQRITSTPIRPRLLPARSAGPMCRSARVQGPARRDRHRQDHRRGGALQPHRPVGLRGQLPGVKAAIAGAAPLPPGAGPGPGRDHRRSVPRPSALLATHRAATGRAVPRAHAGRPQGADRGARRVLRAGRHGRRGGGPGSERLDPAGGPRHRGGRRPRRRGRRADLCRPPGVRRRHRRGSADAADDGIVPFRGERQAGITTAPRTGCTWSPSTSSPTTATRCATCSPGGPSPPSG